MRNKEIAASFGISEETAQAIQVPRSFHIGTGELRQRVPTRYLSSQKRMKIARLVCENGAGASGEVDLDNGGTDAVILDDPERVRLSE